MKWLGISTREDIAPIERGGWLDALRFIVAFLIIIHHYQKAGPLPLADLHPVFERGYFLTNFFLIDSGYVLTRIYGAQVAQGRISWAAFFHKRAARVVPAHLVMLGSLVILVLGANAAGFSPRNAQWFDWSQIPAQAFLVQSYGVPGGIGWNAPTWSISALLGCYLLFPVLVRAASRVSAWSALMGGGVIFLTADLLTGHFLGYPVYQMPLKYGFLRALPLFILGVSMARFAQSIYLPPKLAGPVGLLAVLGLAVIQFFGPFGLWSMALICVIILAAGAIPVTRPSKLVQKAALISFAMFISNEVVRVAYFGVVNILVVRFSVPDAVHWGLWIGGVIAAVVFAVIFYKLIDGPTQTWAQGILKHHSLNSAKFAPASSSSQRL